jgi:hypothetical protein
MRPLEPPDILHLQAAESWLELGNWKESNDAQDQIALQLRAHPNVLSVRWQVFAAAEKWEAALDNLSESSNTCASKHDGYTAPG